MLSNHYRPAGQDAYNLTLMRLIDEQFVKRPFGLDHKVYAYLLNG